MNVGVLEVELAVLESQSLKDKRRVVKGLKDRIRHRFNVSVSEVGFLDAHRKSALGIAMVCESARPIHAQFDRIVELVRKTRGATLLRYDRSFL